MSVVMSEPFVCKVCGVLKPADQLSKSGTTPAPRCKPCEAALRREWRNSRVELRKAQIARQLAGEAVKRELARRHSREYQRLLFEEYRKRGLA